MGIAQGLLEALQGLLEEAEAQEGIAHAQADLASELGGRPGAGQAEAGLAVGDGLVELTQLLVAACQVQVALQEEVGVLQLPGGVDLDHSKLPAAEDGLGCSASAPPRPPYPPAQSLRPGAPTPSLRYALGSPARLEAGTREPSPPKPRSSAFNFHPKPCLQSLPPAQPPSLEPGASALPPLQA